MSFSIILIVFQPLVRLQNVLKEETDSYSSVKALVEAPVVGMYLCIICMHACMRILVRV